MILDDTDTTNLEFSHEIEETSLQMCDVKKEDEPTKSINSRYTRVI